MKTYPILKHLTDAEIERALAHTYTPQYRLTTQGRQACPESRNNRCFLGEALVIRHLGGMRAGSPKPSMVAIHLVEHPEGRGIDPITDLDMLTELTEAFVKDFDDGKIEDLAATVAASRT